MAIWDFFTSSKGEVALAGAAGAAVSVAMEWTGWAAGTRKFLIGGITAYYTAPIGVPIVEWTIGKFLVIPEPNSAGVGGFLMGIGGVVIAEIMLKAFRLRRDELRPKADEEQQP